MQSVTKIIIDTSVKDIHYTTEILEKLPHLPVEYVDDTRPVFEALNQHDDPVSAGKKILVIEKNRGSFLKACPGTNDYICCGYEILNFSTQCNLECAYCILQAYFNNPAIRIFANLDNMFSELEEKIDRDTAHLWRIGTGEFTDSLSLESITGFSKYVIPFFIKRQNTLLELKTKSTQIDFLTNYDPQGRIMLSWSLNSEHIIETEERKTASLEKRLKAARKARDHGYLVSFHFDPIIHYPGWEKDYQKTIALMYDYVRPDDITWISMGCFRYMPPLKDVVLKRHPNSRIFLGEFVRGLDGKMRYPKPLRIHLFRKMAAMLNPTPGVEFHTRCGQHRNPHIYLCMESDEVWEKSFGFSVGSPEGLIEYLDSAIWRE